MSEEIFDGFTKGYKAGIVIHQGEYFTRVRGQILKRGERLWYPLRPGPFLNRVNAAIAHFWESRHKEHLKAKKLEKELVRRDQVAREQAKKSQ